MITRWIREGKTVAVGRLHIIGDANKGIPPRIPVSRSTWYAGIKAGRYPKPVSLSEGIAVWRAVDIDALCRQIEQNAGDTK